MKTHEETLHLLRQAVLAKRAGERVKERAHSAQEDLPLCALDRGGAFPCSSAQQRLWFLDQLDPAASVAYHIPAALKLQGSLDVRSLQATLDRIVARHESLRTRFVQTEDGLTQQFAPVDVGIALEHVDLAGMSSGAQAAIVDERSRSEALRRFDLSTGPLIRGQLLRLSDEDHVLLLTQHHIVSDGWSIGVLIGEIRALYAAITQGLPDPLPALAVQYADYTQWQRQCLQGVALERQLTFWREQLKDAPMLLDLPLDLPRPARQSYEGGIVSFALPDTLTSALRAVSQRQGATLFMILLGAWAVLMSRLSGQEEVVIGTPVANRQRAEVEPLIGFFVNMVALRISVGDVADTSELLQQVRARTLDAYAHQAVPFDLVVESVNPSRTVGRNPIFQTIVSMNSAPRSGALEMPGIRLQPVDTSTGAAQFELALTFTESGSGLVGHLDYAKRLFRHETAERMAESMQQLLRGMAEGEATPLARLQLQGEAGRRAMLALGCGDHVEGTLARVQHAFEQRAAAQPSAPALVFAGHTMDYAELNRHANRLAHLLIEQGVRPGGRVAICCRRGPAMVVAMLAVLKAGAAYVPLNHDYPEALLSFVLEDTAAPVLITDKASEERLPSSSLMQTIVVDGDDATRIAACLDSNPTPSPTPTPAADLAYVIYTSGSTGQPKGVMVEHRQLEHYLHWAQHAYAGDTRIDALVSSPFAFDATITSLYLPLITGGSVQLVPEGTELAALPQLLLDSSAGTLCKITPSHLVVLCEQLAQTGRVCPPHLFVVGGEALPSSTAATLQALAPGARIINEYGPTETTVGCAMQVADGMCQADGTVPIGRPIANTRLYVLDREGQLVPQGVVGEIHIGGGGVARGYLNRPGLTAERFIADPFSTDPQARLYRSGDLGRWRADGTLEYLGRNDQQVKIRGFRIELGEIEAQLVACTGIREAVVVAAMEPGGDRRLVAYLIAEDGAEPVPAVLRDALARRLPEYMLPSAFVVLAAWPLTANGKLDRAALPAADAAAVATRGHEAPVSEIEVQVAGIWAELLGLERVGRQDNFFALGGHSLLAITLIGQLRPLGFSAEVHDIFASPTLASFCAALQREPGAEEVSTESAVDGLHDAVAFEEFRV